MSQAKRRRFNEEQKVEAIKRHLVGKEKISIICDDLQIHPNQFYEWQRHFFENGARAFQKVSNKQNNTNTAKIEHLEAKMDTVLARLEDEGTDVAGIDEKVDEFSEKVNSAKESYTLSVELFKQAKEARDEGNTEEAQSLLGESRTALKEGQRLLREAHAVLMDIMRLLKGIEPEAVEELEVEEEEEVEVVEDEADITEEAIIEEPVEIDVEGEDEETEPTTTTTTIAADTGGVV